MYTPTTIGLEFDTAIKKLTATKAIIEITGIYAQGSGKRYSDSYYDKIIDTKNVEISSKILISADKRVLLEQGKICKLSCLTKYDVRNNSPELILKVKDIISSSIINQQISLDSKSLERIRRQGEILQTFYAKSRNNLSLHLKELIKQKRLPAIALVQSEGNETRADIVGALGEHLNKYILQDFFVNMRNEKEVIKILREIDATNHFNLIGLFRGGGAIEKLSVYESLEAGEVIAGLRTLFITAIGHAENEPFIQRISSRSFNTPNDFGYYLKETYINSGREDDLSDRENKLKSSESELERKWNDLRSKDKDSTAKEHSLENDQRELENRNKEFQIAQENFNREKHQNLERERQIELNKDKTRQIPVSAIVAGVLAVLLIVLALYFAATYFLAFSETPKANSANSDQGLKNSSVSSNSSNSKNK